LSTQKIWTDGLWAVISAPHIVVPLANDLQEYASTKFFDAEKEAAKLKQQIDEKASPESIALTANYTVAMLSSASVALQSAMKAYEKADKAKIATPT
jgi:hypothetical protein